MTATGFTLLDGIIVVLYLIGTTLLGVWLGRGKQSARDYFVAGDRIPWWAVLFSVVATETSALTFISIPGLAYIGNLGFLQVALGYVIGRIIVSFVLLPRYYQGELVTAYALLERRFGAATRRFASITFMVTRTFGDSVRLFATAIPVGLLIGPLVAPEYVGPLSILILGACTVVYTYQGGMKAVIWTDVVQVIVKMGGAVFAILFIVWTLKGGFGEFTQIAMAEDKTRLFDFSFDLTKATVWGFIFLVLFEVVLTFPKDQVLMQRVLSTKSDKEAGRSVWAFAAMMIPGGFVFYGIGTALFVYYKSNPERMNPLLPVDATFPLFIAAELPMGVTGLIIAGIFAAAMATLSGIMNSVATLITVDFYDRFAKDKSQKKGVFFAEAMTVVVGLVGIGAALVLSRFDVQSLFDVSIELAGLLGGGFAGAYTLGMFTRRANAPGVAIGIGAAVVLTFVAWCFDLVHPYFYLAISILVCVVVGYLASLCFPPPTCSLKGLTIHRQDAADPAP